MSNNFLRYYHKIYRINTFGFNFYNPLKKILFLEIIKKGQSAKIIFILAAYSLI